MPRASALIALLPLLLAPAAGASTGGTSFPAPPVGGTAYGAASTARPTIGRFAVPKRVRADKVPVVKYRIDEAVGGAVRVRIAVLPLGRTAAKGPLSLDQGRRATGRLQRVRWGHGTRLARGRYLVRLHAVDDAGHTLVRTAYASGRATLTVVAPPKKKAVAKPKPKPAASTPAPAPSASTAPPPGPSSPVATVVGPVTAGVFPVAGAHTYGDGIGAARTGHTHQGQDILAGCGVPIRAAQGGTVRANTFQAAGAGNYMVIKGSLTGEDYMYAHMAAPGSPAVGAPVAAGTVIGVVGATGDATGCHLHFEMWTLPGWYLGGYPYDPLPSLQTWDNYS